MKIVITLLAVLVINTASLFAELGETPSQFETGVPTSTKKYENGLVTLTWNGKTVSHIGVFQNNKCIYESFQLADHSKKIPPEDLKRFLEPYAKWTATHSHNNKNGVFNLISDPSDNKYVVAYWFDGNVLSIMTLEVWNRVFEEDNAVSKTEAKPSPTPNDCLIVATEIYSRLKTSAYWAKIMTFSWTEDDEEKIKHAVVIYQPTEASNIYVYDKLLIGGSYDLETKSYDLNDIMDKLKGLVREGVTIDNPQWIE